MDKKKLSIIIFSLATILALILGLFVFLGKSSNNATKNEEENKTSTAKLQDGTSYKGEDIDSEYDKMIANSKKQYEIEKKIIAKEKAEKEKRDKEKEKKEIALIKKINEAKTAQERAQLFKDIRDFTYNDDKLKTTIREENGHTVKENGYGVVTLDNGKNGQGTVASNKPKGDGIADGRKPFYEKYEEKADEKIYKKKTSQTKILTKYFEDDKYLIVNQEADVKDDLLASVFIPQKDSKDFIMSAADVSGTVKKEKLGDKARSKLFTIDEDYLDKNKSDIYVILKEFDIPLSKGEFSQLYKNYKAYKFEPMKNVYISNDGLGVTVQW